MKLKNRLKYYRHQHMMTQKEFADYLGYNYSQYNRWERQQLQPNVITSWEIAKKLKIHMEELFEVGE